jgi:hypothetical protein
MGTIVTQTMVASVIFAMSADLTDSSRANITTTARRREHGSLPHAPRGDSLVAEKSSTRTDAPERDYKLV